MTEQEKLKYLMDKTGKGEIVCDISLLLSGVCMELLEIE
jgi:hypothetical protein